MADDTRNAKLNLQVEEKGAEKAADKIAEIGKGATELQKELGRMSRVADLDKIAKEFGEVARQTDDVAGAVDELNKKLKELGANESEIKRVANAFEVERSRSFDAPSPGGASGGGGAPAAAKFRGAAGLIGGEGLANVVGVIDDVQDSFEGLTQIAKAAPSALASAASALGPVGIGLAAVAAVAAAAFVAASQSIREEAAKIDEVSKARLSLDQRLPDLTQSEAQAELNRNAEVRENLLKTLAKAEQEYNDFLREQPDLVGNLGDNLLKVFDDREAAKEKAITDAKAAIQALEAESQTLQEALSEGKVKADEVVASEQKLAEVRQTEAAKGVDTAIKAEKDRAREAEKVAADAQRAQEKAQQEAEQNAEKAAAAQDNYTKAIKSATTNYENAVADLGRKRIQGELDIRTSMGRDLDDIELKNNQDVTKLIRDDWIAARDAAFENANEIEDIRREGQKNVLEAYRDGDFKQAYLAKEAAAERLAEEARTDDREDQMRRMHLADQREDLRISLRQEQDARRTAGIRSFEDLKTNISRELETAAIGRQRANALAAEARNNDLRQLAGHLNRVASIYQQHFQQVERMASNMGNSGGAFNPGQTIPSGTFNSSQTIPLNMISQIIG